MPNAPHGVVTTLAKNDNIAVAGPVLNQSRIYDPDLKYIAETKSQAHLLALSTRVGLSETLSDVLVRRGDREVARSIATNHKANLSESAFATLVKRAERDSALAEKVGPRTDIPPRLFRQLLVQASGVVQQRLLANAKPETQAEIQRVLAKVTERGRRQGCAAQLHGGAGDGAGAEQGSANSPKPTSPTSPSTANTKRRFAALAVR